MKRQYQAGFTLIEVVVAIAIITIAMLPAATMRLKAAQADATIEEREKFAILIQRLVETKVRGIPYDQVLPSSAVDPETGLTYDIVVEDQKPTLRRVTITVVAPGEPAPIDRLVTLVAKEAVQ